MSNLKTELFQQNWARICEDQQRQDFLDSLYIQDGRDKADHPMHSLYTGLYQQWLADGNSCGDAVSSDDVLGDLCPSSVSV